MLSDIIIGRAHQQQEIDLHRHAELNCKPSLLQRLFSLFNGNR